MNIYWDINWAPTIVTIVVTALFTYLGLLVQRKWSSRHRLPSENIEVSSPEGTTQRFKGVKTYSQRHGIEKPDGTREFSEVDIQFEGPEGVSTVSAEEIQRTLEETEAEKNNQNAGDS